MVPDLHERINFDFTNHKPTDEAIELMEKSREFAKNFAHHVARLPQGREQSLAITKIEEALFYANAAVARNMTEDKNNA